jgi:hypothetical protein
VALTRRLPADDWLIGIAEVLFSASNLDSIFLVRRYAHLRQGLVCLQGALFRGANPDSRMFVVSAHCLTVLGSV